MEDRLGSAAPRLSCVRPNVHTGSRIPGSRLLLKDTHIKTRDLNVSRKAGLQLYFNREDKRGRRRGPHPLEKDRQTEAHLQETHVLPTSVMYRPVEMLPILSKGNSLAFPGLP